MIMEEAFSEFLNNLQTNRSLQGRAMFLKVKALKITWAF